MLNLYTNIKNRRLELDLTQTQLAERLGYADKSMIAKIEKGQIDLSHSKILALAAALQTTPGDLMGWEDEASSSAAVPVPAADPNEGQLIAMYRELNSAGQKKLREYAEDLLDNDKYKKGSIKNAVVG